MAGHRNPEIQRVLATLNSFSQQGQHPQQQSFNTSYGGSNYGNQRLCDTNITADNITPGLGLLQPPTTYDRPITPPTTHRKQSRTPSQLQYQSRMSSPQLPAVSVRVGASTAKLAIPDASNITTWPAALKHVTRHLVPNEQVANRVKHLINEQHKHERQWWDGREAIVARQQGSSRTSQQVSAILKSLGASVSQPVKPENAPADAEQSKAYEAELKSYDEKVHEALLAMTAHFDRQLRDMKVPFYAIKHELVILEDEPEKTIDEHKGKIDKGELRELQKRMCQTLEDLFGDEQEARV